MADTFVTIFPAATEVHLHKDVGMIPYILQRDYGFRSKLVSAGVLQDRALETEQLSGPVALWYYLYRNAAKIDVLNLYHHSRSSWLAGWWYKKCNPQGILYLKVDANRPYFERLRQQTSFKRNQRFWNYFFKQIADIVSCESLDICAFLETYYPASKAKLLYQPNGIDPQSWTVPVPESFEEKERIILIAGRIGAPEKNHELLLAIFKTTDLNGWKVIFAGPVIPAFQSAVDLFFKEAPHLQGIVSFTGNVSMEGMGDLYRRSRLFVLSSRIENFPLVLTEAMYYGCYVISTDTGCVRELLQDGALGTIVNDDYELADAIRTAMRNDILLAERFPVIKAEAIQRYSWTSLLRPLQERIAALKKQGS